MNATVRYPLRDDPSLQRVRLPFVAVLDEVLTSAMCDELVQRIEAESPTLATINAYGGAVVDTRTRNNERVIFDDAPLAAELFARTSDALPAVLEGGKLVGYNERFRGYRYRPGQRFGPHFDGAFARPMTSTGREMSLITVLFYLNAGFSGGETKLLDYDYVYTPKRGSVLFFAHATYHEGSEVTAGTKYVLRSDAMYWFESEP